MKRSNYIDKFIRSRCAPDLLALGFYPNSKEITESMGAMVALSQIFPRNKPLQVVCPGDGVWPRTAAMIAFTSRWMGISVDPKARPIPDKVPGCDQRLERIESHKCKIEDWESTLDPRVPVAVAAVHSHASLRSSVDAIPEDCHIVGVVSIPCCVPDDLGVPPNKSYRDLAIHSPANRVNIWYDWRFA